MMEGGVDKSQKNSSYEKNNAKDDIHKIDDNVKSSKVNKTSNVIIMQRNDLQCEKKTFCSDDVKKHVSLLFILIFFVLMLLSFGVFLVITFTNIFNENIVENLVLKNGTKSLEWWIDSPLKPLLKVHIFNYTNIEAVLRGKEKKIKVEDIGPYVYEEEVKRVNLTYHEGNKITSYEDRIQLFSRKHSPAHLKEDDLVMVPNVPLILSINKVESDAVSKLLLKTVISTTSPMPQEFQMKSVKEYLFGYTDSFINKIAFGMTDFKPEKIGILGARRGISTDNLTIYTGEDSLENLGKIYAMNNESKMNIWSTEECNEIVGTDGSQFPPSWLDGERNLEVFIKSICRPFPLKFETEVTVLNGLPAWRYRPIPNVFGSSLVNPDNECYCDSSDPKNKCPPSGVFDSEKCAGVAILMSYPHFFEGDEILLEPFEGLNPNAEEHATFADIHPRMAFPIGGASRLQVNMRVKKLQYGFFAGSTFYKNLPNELILPVCWFELTAGEISADLMAMIFNTTHSANTAYLTIQYGSIICMFVSFLLTLSTALLYYRNLAGKESKSKCKKEMKCCSSKDIVVMLKTQQTDPIYPSLPQNV